MNKTSDHAWKKYIEVWVVWVNSEDFGLSEWLNGLDEE